MKSRKKFIAVVILALLSVGLFSCSGSDRRRARVLNQEKKDSLIFTDLKVNVFLENSGSMDGYVKGSTEFEDIVYDYLVRVKTTPFFDNLPDQPIENLNLYYINSEAIPQGNDVPAFINGLEPASFKAKGGNRGNSDIAQVLDKILAMSDSTTISIFISDCIFSPGKQDAMAYLNKQSTTIMGSFYDYMLKKDPNLCVIAYRLLSTFNGTYYDRRDAASKINVERPFYIWLLGGKKYLENLTSKVRDDVFKGKGLQNKLVIYKGPQAIKYSVQRGSGKFELDRNPERRKNTIIDLQKGRDNLYSFGVDLDFSHLMLDDDYLVNTHNYTATDTTFRMKIEKNPTSKEYTHVARISNVKPKRNINLKVGLYVALPDWVEAYNDSEGIGLPEENYDKTFGIKYLIEGVNAAFKRFSDYYTNFEIQIN